MRLYEIIMKNAKKSFQTSMENNKKYNNIANYGLKIGEVATRKREGEYSGFAIKALETIKPLLTNHRVSKAVKMYEQNNDLESAINVLCIQNEAIQYGTNIYFNIVVLWLKKNDIEVPEEYENNKIDENIINEYETIKKWVLTTKSEPIMGRISISEIGQHAKNGHSVVPEEWLGKEYENAVNLHKEMDKLDWRQNKPPVCYCCTYGMTITKNGIYGWKKIKDTNLNTNMTDIEFIMVINMKNTKYTRIIVNDKNKDIKEELKKEYGDENYDILECSTRDMKKYLITCKKDEIENKNVNYVKKTMNVGLMVSMLQKSIRRGSKCASTLLSVIQMLSMSKPYNLPEQQYIRVSSFRQLCWRLFITIMEDVRPYEILDNEILDDEIGNKNRLSMLDLIILSVLCHNDPDFCLAETVIEKIIEIGLIIQSHDKIGDNWEWRLGDELEGSNETVLRDNENEVIKSIKLALICMPMMQNDRRLLQNGIKLMKNDENMSIKICKKDDGEDIVLRCLSESESNKNSECIRASYDNHSNPNIIIQFQSNLPFIPYDTKRHTTVELSHFIWENSSKINVRNMDLLKIEEIKKTNKIKIEDKVMKFALQDIQDYFAGNNNMKEIIKFKKIDIEKGIKTEELTEGEKRIIFLLIFGKTFKLQKAYKGKNVEIIVCGDNKKPCRVKIGDKYVEGKERWLMEKKFVEYLNEKQPIIKLKEIPEYCKWTKNEIKINAKIIESNEEEYENEIIWYIDDSEVPVFS